MCSDCIAYPTGDEETDTRIVFDVCAYAHSSFPRKNPARLYSLGVMKRDARRVRQLARLWYHVSLQGACWGLLGRYELEVASFFMPQNLVENFRKNEQERKGL